MPVLEEALPSRAVLGCRVHPVNLTAQPICSNRVRAVPGQCCAHQVRIEGLEAIVPIGLIGVPDPGIVTGADHPAFHLDRSFSSGTKSAPLPNAPGVQEGHAPPYSTTAPCRPNRHWPGFARQG